jgi:hypothetical protein
VRVAASGLAVLALLACAPDQLGAQFRASLDVGGGEIGYGIVPAKAVVLNGRVDLRRHWLQAGASGSAYRFERSSATSGLSSGWLMLRPSAWRGLSGELLASGSSTNHHGFYRSRRVDGRAGATLAGDDMEATVRYGVARGTRDGVPRTANRVEFELSGAVGRAELTLFGSRNGLKEMMPVVRDTTYMVAGFPFRGRYHTEASVSRAYLDAEARLAWQVRSASWGVVVGARRGDATTSGERWQRVDVVLPVNPGIALIATAGRRPAIPEERLPGGSFATMGVQVSVHGTLGETPPDAAGDREAPRFVMLDVGAGRKSMSLIGVVADRVEIIADFTDWKPVDLSRIGERVWHITLPVAPGMHRVSIRTDGGGWGPPPGLPVTADEFMGTVGILLIE